MSIVGINGLIRSGKGVLLSKLALESADAGMEVLTNYPLRHKNARQISLYEFLCLLKKERNMQKVKLSIQEIWAWMNSHRSGSNVSEIEDALVFQSGKLGYLIDYDTQVEMRALGSLRYMTSTRFEAVCVGDPKVSMDGWFEYYPLDVRVHSGNVRLKGVSPLVVPFRLAASWWDQFDTFERTFPVGYDNMILEMAKAEPSIMNVEVNKMVDLLMLEKNRDLWFKPDRVSVESALLELGQPVVFSSLVACRLGMRLRQQRDRPLSEKSLFPDIRSAWRRR